MNKQDVRSEHSSGSSVRFRLYEDRGVAQPSSRIVAASHHGKKLPDWFAEAPAMLNKHIVEQRYQSAVDLIKRATVYAEANKDLSTVRIISHDVAKLAVTQKLFYPKTVTT